MKQISIIVAITIVLFGVYFSQKNNNSIEIINSNPNKENESIDEVVEPTVVVTGDAQPTPNEKTVITIKPSPTVAINDSDGFISSFIYSNSSMVSKSGGSMSMESTDSPDAITNWYKNEINNQNMNVNSFVTTSNNDNILNKLVGANSINKVEVDISKNASSSTVKIDVRITI